MNKHVKDMRDGSHPLRRPKDYVNGVRRRKWSKPERKYRLAYRRRPFATAASTVAAVLASATIAYGGSQVASIFQGTQYDNSGWATCEAPISWTIDTGTNFQQDLSWAFNQWAEKTGYEFIYAGEAETTFDDTNSRLASVAEMNRNIAITFMPDRNSTMLTDKVVGFAGPSLVYGDSKTIVGAYIVFNIDYSISATQKQRRALFLHEIGHALGLADSKDPNNVMYWTVDRNLTLTQEEALSAVQLRKDC